MVLSSISPCPQGESDHFRVRAATRVEVDPLPTSCAILGPMLLSEPVLHGVQKGPRRPHPIIQSSCPEPNPGFGAPCSERPLPHYSMVIDHKFEIICTRTVCRTNSVGQDDVLQLGNIFRSTSSRPLNYQTSNCVWMLTIIILHLEACDYERDHLVSHHEVTDWHHPETPDYHRDCTKGAYMGPRLLLSTSESELMLAFIFLLHM